MMEVTFKLGINLDDVIGAVDYFFENTNSIDDIQETTVLQYIFAERWGFDDPSTVGWIEIPDEEMRRNLLIEFRNFYIVRLKEYINKELRLERSDTNEN